MPFSMAKLVVVALVAAFFAALALNLTVPLTMLSVMAAVDRLLVFAFLQEREQGSVSSLQFGEGEMA